MKHLLLLSLLFSIARCTNHSSPGGEPLPYSVDPLALEGPVTEISQDPSDPLHLRQSLPVRICLKEPTTLVPITSLRFSVVGTGREVTPDHRGCFVHMAQVAYRPQAPEAFVPQTVTLQAAESMEPAFTLSFWVNPWDRQISDPRYAGKPAGAVETEKKEDALMGLGEFSPARWFPDAGRTFFSNLAVRSFDMEPGTPRSTQDSTEMSLSLRLKIDLRTRRIDGTYRSMALPRHTLRARLALIDRRTRARLGGWPAPVTVKVEAGEAVITEPAVTIDRLPEPRADLAWYLRLEPESVQSGLIPWEGEVAVAAGALGRAPRGPALEKEPAQFELLAVAPPSADTTARPHGFFLDRWTVKYARNLQVTPKGYEANAGANAEVCLTDSITGEPLSQQRFSVELSEKAEISAKAILTVSDPSGCVRPGSAFPIAYPYFSPETYLTRQLVVRAESGPQAGVLRSVQVAVNPWQKDDDLFFWDMRRGPAPSNPENRRAGIHLSEFSYQYPPQKDDLQLDPQMKLTYKDVFYVIMKPTVNRPFAFSKDRGPTRATEGLWPGLRFRVRMAVTGTRLPTLPNTDRFSHLRLLSGYETTVTVDDRGMLVIPVAVAYDFNERPLLETVGRVYLEIRAEGENGPDPVTLEAPFDPVSDGAHAIDAIPMREQFDDIIAQLVPREMVKREMTLSEAKLSALSIRPDAYRLWKPGQANVERPINLFLNRVSLPGNMTRVDVTDSTAWPSELANGAFTPGDFNRLLGSEGANFDRAASESLRKLCGLYFEQPAPPPAAPTRNMALMRGQSTILCHQAPRANSSGPSLNLLSPTPKSLFEQCIQRPEYYLRLHRFRFVDGIVSEPIRLPTNTTTLQMNASFFQEQSDMDTQHKGHSSSHNLDAGVTAKVGFETFGNGATAHVSYLYKNSWFTSRDRSLSTSTRNRLQIQEMRTLVAEESRVQVDADVQDCVFFRHRPWMTRTGLTEAGRSEKAYFLCLPSRRRITESWFYVSDSVPNTSLPRRDAKDLRNRVWLVLLRGTDQFNHFKGLIENRASQVDIGRAPVFANGIDHLLNDVYRDIEHPFGLFGDDGLFPGVINHSSRQ